jgi:hypothetical protein
VAPKDLPRNSSIEDLSLKDFELWNWRMRDSLFEESPPADLELTDWLAGAAEAVRAVQRTSSWLALPTLARQEFGRFRQYSRHQRHPLDAALV